jgi:SulP family sulfate permease
VSHDKLRLVNLSAGSRARLSRIVAALAIFICLPVIELLPIAALVGVDDNGGDSTFEWTIFRITKNASNTIYLLES